MNEKKQMTFGDSLFEFQLDILKTEINQIQKIIAGIDKITQQIKYWTIIIWAGSISLLISSSNIELRKYILFIVTIPFLFWVVDATFRSRQRRFLYRNKKISEFINGEDLEISFRQKKLSNFVLLDPLGKQYNKKDLRKFTNIIRTMLFKSMIVFYLGLIVVTVSMHIVLNSKTINLNTKSIHSKEYSDSVIISNQNVIINELKSLKTEIDSLKNRDCYFVIERQNIEKDIQKRGR